MNQLKKDYVQVKFLHEKSGFGWDDVRKLVTAMEEVWEVLVMVSSMLCTDIVTDKSIKPTKPLFLEQLQLCRKVQIYMIRPEPEQGLFSHDHTPFLMIRVPKMAENDIIVMYMQLLP